jgi:aquaporin Z
VPVTEPLVAVDRVVARHWVYVVDPLLGAAVAVGGAFVLRGPSAGESGSGAAQGVFGTQVARPEDR